MKCKWEYDDMHDYYDTVGGCIFGTILFLFLFFIILKLTGKNIWIH